MKKKILYIDLDGVVADFMGRVEKIDPSIYSMDAEQKNNRIDEMLIAHPHIFLELLPIGGAIESIKNLMKLYEVLFLSTPVDKVPESFTDKRIWLSIMFGEQANKRLILTHHKELAIGDFLVDDRLKNGADEFIGEHIHFGTKKAKDWHTVFNYLLQKWKDDRNPDMRTIKSEKQIREHVQSRINELYAADKKACEDRWNPVHSSLERAVAREFSNQYTFARQELQSVIRYIDKQ